MAERKIEQKSAGGGRRKRRQQTKSLDQAGCNRDRNWHQDELLKLAAFIHHHKEKLTGGALRKQSKIFKMMSLYLSTRNSNQCRAYTHKLLKKFKTVDAVDDFFKACLRNYQQAIEREEGRLKRMIFPLPVVAREREEQLRALRLGQVEEKVEKQEEKDLKPTDLEYYEDRQIHDGSGQSQFSSKKTPNNEQPQIDNIKQSLNSRQFYRNCLYSPSIFCESSFSSSPTPPKTPPKVAPTASTIPANSQQWLECHELFLEWTMKLAKLMQRHGP